MQKLNKIIFKFLLEFPTSKLIYSRAEYCTKELILFRSKMYIEYF